MAGNGPGQCTKQTGTILVDSTTEASTSSSEKDQDLVDFLEEVINDAGPKSVDRVVRKVVNRLHEKKVDTVEDLLNLTPIEFIFFLILTGHGDFWTRSMMR